MKFKLLAIIVSVSIHANELHKAVSEHNMSEIERILNKEGFENIINQRDDNGQTPLSIAVEKKDREIVKLLLAYTFNNNASMHGKQSLLQFVLKANLIKSIDQPILNNNADVNSHREMDGATPLHIATYGGDIATVTLLLEKGADVHCRMNNGDTALHTAVQVNNTEIAQLLLANGADVNSLAVDSQNAELRGVTPLMGAGVLGHLALVKLLLEHGANPAIETRCGLNIFKMIADMLECKNDPLLPAERSTYKNILDLCAVFVVALSSVTGK